MREQDELLPTSKSTSCLNQLPRNYVEAYSEPHNEFKVN